MRGGVFSKNIWERRSEQGSERRNENIIVSGTLKTVFFLIRDNIFEIYIAKRNRSFIKKSRETCCNKSVKCVFVLEHYLSKKTARLLRRIGFILFNNVNILIYIIDLLTF